MMGPHIILPVDQGFCCDYRMAQQSMFVDPSRADAVLGAVRGSFALRGGRAAGSHSSNPHGTLQGYSSISSSPFAAYSPSPIAGVKSSTLPERGPPLPSGSVVMMDRNGISTPSAAASGFGSSTSGSVQLTGKVMDLVVQPDVKFEMDWEK